MRKPMVMTLCVSVIVALVAIIVSQFTHESGWIFIDVTVGFIFLLAAGLGLGGNAGDGGGSIFIRRTFQEMYQDQPGKIKKLNKKAGTASLYCLCIGLPNLLLPIAAAVMFHYY